MEQMNNQWFWAAIVGFLIGAVIVWLFMRNGRHKNEESIAALQKEYNQYRENVNAHFAKTADAVDNLTKSYQDVFTHLSEGAETLMDKKALRAQLEKRQGKAVTLAYLVDEKEGSKSQATKIEQKSVVDHQSTIAKPAQAQTNKPAQTQQTKKVESTPQGQRAAKQASDNVQVKTTGQSVPLDHKASANAGQRHTGQASAGQAKPSKASQVHNPVQNPVHDKAQNQPQPSKAKPQQPVRPESKTTTVNTTNQPVAASKSASAKDGHAKPQQPVRAESTTTTVNTTNQPAPAKTPANKRQENTLPDNKPQAKPDQVKQGEASATEAPEITPAQEAALKAGLKPASASKATAANAPNKTPEAQESAIETVKRHIRDNNKPS